MIIVLAICVALLALFCFLLFLCIGSLHKSVTALQRAESDRLARELNGLIRERAVLVAERDAILRGAHQEFICEADAAVKH